MNPILKQLCRYHIPSALCGIVILLLCVIQLPPDETPITIPNLDKIVHFTMFFTFSLLFIGENRMLSDKKWKEPVPLFGLTVLFTAILGGIIEVIQGELTDYRSADIYDWYSDMIGSLAAVAISGSVIVTRSLMQKAVRK